MVFYVFIYLYGYHHLLHLLLSLTVLLSGHLFVFSLPVYLAPVPFFTLLHCLSLCVCLLGNSAVLQSGVRVYLCGFHPRRVSGIIISLLSQCVSIATILLVCVYVCVGVWVWLFEDWISQKLFCEHHTEFIPEGSTVLGKFAWVNPVTVSKHLIYSVHSLLFYLISPSRWWREHCPAILISQWTSKLIILH